MSVLGNDFQHTIGLVTAGTEIMTGQAGKVARGLRTIGNRFADAAQQADSIEYSVGGVTKSLSLLDETTGDIKSTFDIFQGLKSDWDAMTNSEKQALAITYAGQTQFEVFAAVMNNFQTAVDATSTAFDSAGSAMQENQKYMDSVAAKENQLKAEFEDFSNRVLSKELVTGFLSAGQAALSFANNDVGAAIVRIAGLSAGAFALVGILGQVAKAIKGVMSAATSIGSLATTIGQIATVVGLVVAAVTAVVEIVRAINTAIEQSRYDYLIDQYHQLSDEAEELSNNLETTKQKLQELNETPAYERGEAWEKENQELREQIEAYEFLLELKERDAALAREKAMKADVVSGVQVSGVGEGIYSKVDMETGMGDISDIIGSAQLVGFRTDEYMEKHPELAGNKAAFTEEQIKAITAEYENEEDAVRALSKAFQELYDEATVKKIDEAILAGDFDKALALRKKGLYQIGITFGEVVQSSEEYMQSQMQSASNLNSMLFKATNVGKQLTTAQQESIDDFISSNKERYEYIIDLGEEASDTEQRFAQKYESFAKQLASYNVSNNIMSTGEAVQYLVNSLGLPLDSAIELTNGIYGISESAKVTKDDFEELADGTVSYIDAMTKCQRAISEFNDTGKLSETTLKDIADEFADVDGIDNYIDKLSSADLTAEELEETLYALMQAKIDVMLATDNFSNGLVGEIIQFVNEQNASEATRKALALYALQKMLANKEKLTTSASIENLQALALAAGQTSLVIQQLAIALKYFNLAKDATGAYAGLYTANYEQALKAAQALAKNVGTTSGSDTDDRTSPTGSGGGGTKTDKELERLKNIVSLRESELDLMEKQDKPYDERIRKMKEIQDALHDQAEHIRKTTNNLEDINKLSSKWWSIQKDINNLLKEAAEAAKDVLQKQADDIESAFDYAIKMAQKEMDAINEKYDKQLEDIENANDALQKQITLEEKLKAIAEAKSKKLYVYKDGRFQYVDDVDAINEAQSDYEEFLREKNIESQKEQIEADRKAELAIWEQWVTNWQNVTDSYKDAQDRLLAEQVLGISFEANNWAHRLGNAEDFKIKYAAIMAEIAQLQSQIDSGGVSYDPNVDYSALMEKATSKEEFEYLAAMRDAKAKDMGVDYTKAGYRTNEQLRQEKGFARGTLNAPAGLSLVGEEGPELRVLQKGDAIFSADMTKNLWEWGKIPPSAFKLSKMWGGGETSQQYVFNIDNLSLPGVTDAPSLLSGLKRMAYQRAFGRA